MQSSLHLPEPKTRQTKQFFCAGLVSPYSMSTPCAHLAVTFLQVILSVPALPPSAPTPKYFRCLSTSHFSQIPGPRSAVFVLPCVCCVCIVCAWVEEPKNEAKRSTFSASSFSILVFCLPWSQVVSGCCLGSVAILQKRICVIAFPSKLMAQSAHVLQRRHASLCCFRQRTKEANVPLWVFLCLAATSKQSQGKGLPIFSEEWSWENALWDAGLKLGCMTVLQFDFCNPITFVPKAKNWRQFYKLRRGSVLNKLSFLLR